MPRIAVAAQSGPKALIGACTGRKLRRGGFLSPERKAPCRQGKAAGKVTSISHRMTKQLNTDQLERLAEIKRKILVLLSEALGI